MAVNKWTLTACRAGLIIVSSRVGEMEDEPPDSTIPLPIIARSHGALLYLVDCLDGKLLFDAGWPRSLPDLKSGMEAAGLRLSAIRFVIASHAHPDHAGLVQKLKRYCGVRVLVHEKQRGSLMNLNRFFERKPDRDYEPI